MRVDELMDDAAVVDDPTGQFAVRTLWAAARGHTPSEAAPLLRAEGRDDGAFRAPGTAAGVHST
jgi:hypothetical protein